MAERVPNRVQVNEPQYDTRLRPAAAPVDTYVRPAPIQQENTWTQLAKSLAEINPKITHWMEDYADSRKEDANQWALGKIAGMTHQEAKQAVLDGTLPEFSDPWKKAALEKYAGIIGAAGAGQELVRRYNTEFDKVNGNLDDLIKSVYSDATKGMEGSKFFMSGFGVDFLKHAAALRAQQTKDRTTENRVDAVDKVMGVFRTDIEKAAADGDLGRISGVLDTRYKQNQSVLSVDKRTQDDIVWQLANEYAAKGRKDIVETLLNHKGSDGTILRDRVKFAPHADALLNKAEDAGYDAARKTAIGDRLEWFKQSDAGALDVEKFQAWLAQPENRSKFKPETIEQMLRHDAHVKLEAAKKASSDLATKQLDRTIHEQEDRAIEYGLRAGDMGSLSAVDRVRFFTKDDVKYDRKEPTGGWSASEFKSKVVDAFLEKSAAQYTQDVAQGRDQADAQRAQFQRELQWFTKNGMNHPRWEQMLQAGAQAASLPTITGKPEDISPVIQQGAALYTQLYAQAPSMAAAMIKDQRSMQFYEAYRLASMTSSDPQHALLLALDYTKDPTKYKDTPEYRAKLDDIRRRVSVGAQSWWYPFDVTPKNKEFVASQVNELAQFYAHWTDLDTAVKEAAKTVRNNLTNINGYAVPKPVGAEGTVLPPGFEKLVEARIDAFAKEFGKQHGFSSSDLMVIAPTNGIGTWKIVTAGAHSALPYGTKGMNNPIFTAKDLWDDYTRQQGAERAKAQFEAINGEPHSKMYDRLKKMSEPQDWQGKPAIDPTSPLRPDLQQKLDQRNKQFMDWLMGRSQDTRFQRSDQYPNKPPYTK